MIRRSTFTASVVPLVVPMARESVALPHSRGVGVSQVPQGAKVPLNEYEFPTKKIANVQSQLEKLVEKNYYLHTSARDAYRAYILAYNSHTLKDVYNVHSLDLNAVASSFGFHKRPRFSSTSTPRRARRARNLAARAVREAITDVKKAPVTILARKIHTEEKTPTTRVNSCACNPNP